MKKSFFKTALLALAGVFGFGQSNEPQNLGKRDFIPDGNPIFSPRVNYGNSPIYYPTRSQKIKAKVRARRLKDS